MSAQKSTGLANHLAVTGSLKSALDGGRIYIYSGAMPASADDAVTGQLLVTISMGGGGLTFEDAARDGVLTKAESEVWSGQIQSGGTATFFRFATEEPSGSSVNAIRLKGTVGTTVLADIVLMSAELVAGNEQRINLFQIY